MPAPHFSTNIRTKLERLRNFLLDLRHGDLRNPLLDLRYGGLLRGSISTRYAHLGAYDTGNADVGALERIFKDRVGPHDVLVDVGCGKGRAINWWLSQGFRNKIIGLELDADIAAATQRRLRRHKNVSIIAGDALEHLPPDGTLFFVFNSFQEAVVIRFREQMLALYGDRAAITIFYLNPVHLDIFQADHHWQIEFHAGAGGRLHDWAVLKIKSGRS